MATRKALGGCETTPYKSGCAPSTSCKVVETGDVCAPSRLRGWTLTLSRRAGEQIRQKFRSFTRAECEKGWLLGPRRVAPGDRGDIILSPLFLPLRNIATRNRNAGWLATCRGRTWHRRWALRGTIRPTDMPCLSPLPGYRRGTARAP